jgi:uncharacterized membrane protein (DUF4010 family)
MEKLYTIFPQELVSFVFVVVFSLLIGLSQRKLSLHSEGENTHFGTDRTFTFIGILGYLLYMLDPKEMRLFIAGGFALTVLFGLNYYQRMVSHHVFGITSIVIGLITYCLAPIVSTQPSWFYITVIVAVLLLTEMKSNFVQIAQKMQNDEFITLAKFLAISGVILPILPENNLVKGIDLTPYTVWLATVIVSGISYLSYLLKRYVFPNSGIYVSGILGGLYSSTATLIILGRKCKKAPIEEIPQYLSAILMSVSMAYLRFMILVFIFSYDTFISIFPYLLIMAIVSGGYGMYVHHHNLKENILQFGDEELSNNPLEFKVALIFAGLLVVFTIVTHYTFMHTGSMGLNVLSFISGITDITPYILNLLQWKGGVSVHLVGLCSLQAIVSNNVVGMVYAIFFSGRRKELISGLTHSYLLVILINVILLFFYSFI